MMMFVSLEKWRWQLLLTQIRLFFIVKCSKLDYHFWCQQYDQKDMRTKAFCFCEYLQVLAATDGFINCSCNHLTAFGGSLLIKPNPIDFDKVQVEFNRLPETGNIAVIVTLATVVFCYTIALIIVRKTDKRDGRDVSMKTRFFLHRFIEWVLHLEKYI